MKLGRFIKYDIERGIIQFWKRYILIIIFIIIGCQSFFNNAKYWIEIFNSTWTPLEYGIYNFWGRMPYDASLSSTDGFILPFPWITIYIILAMCIGNYINEDMHGFGTQMFIQSGKRFAWWVSKVIWCMLANIVYFCIIWGVNVSYAWIRGGDIRFAIHKSMLNAYYGSEIVKMDEILLIGIVVFMPVLVGIVQSMFQLVCSLYIDSSVSVIFISFMLVLSSYYSGKWIFHGYAMCQRFLPNSLYNDFAPLNYQFGIVYMVSIIIIMFFSGYALLSRKDIL